MIERKRHAGGRKKRPAPETLDPMESAMAQYLEWIATHGFSEDTVATRRVYSRLLSPMVHRARIAYSGRDHTAHPRTLPALAVSLPQEQRPAARVSHPAHAPAIDQKRAAAYIEPRFFQWMARQNLLLHNPASEIVLPRMENRLPKYVLTVQEAEQVIQRADINDPEGLRDRAILETFYSTGMRRMELAGLKLYDLDTDRRTLTIRQGKGRKDRIIPVGERALAWIHKYVEESRPQLLTSLDEGTAFLTHLGEPFDRKQLTALVRRYLIDSGVGKMGGCHLFRHTVATLMLENGADIRVIQQMLGHVKLTTTELYTRVSINLLRQVYSATHPGAHLKPAEPVEAEAVAELLEEDDVEADE